MAGMMCEPGERDLDHAARQALADQQEAAHAASIERQRREAEREQRRLEERKARRAAARS